MRCRRGRDSSRARRGSGGCDDVILADTATDASASDAREVDAGLRSKLANQRGDVACVARCDRSRSHWCRNGHWCRCRYWGSNRGGYRSWSGHWGGCNRCSDRSRSLNDRSWSGSDWLGCRGRCLGRSGGTIADDCQDCANLDGLVFLDKDLLDNAGNRRRDLGVDLVGRDFYQWLIDGDGVADLLDPSGDGTLGYALAKRWKTYFAHFGYSLIGLRVGVKWLAGQREVCLADGFVHGWVGVD
jgi:hypothetical protein